MSDLHLKVPPTRDIRLRPCNAYGGDLENLVCGQKEGCLSNNGRTFAQTTGCQLTLSMGMAASIPNTVVIYHGPVGCGAGSLALAGQSKMSQLARGNDDAVAGVVVHKRHGKGAPGAQWVTMTVDDLIALLTGERPPS